MYNVIFLLLDYTSFLMKKTIHSKSTVGAGVGVGGSNDGRLVVG